MNLNEVREVIRQTIAEAMDSKLPKSGGKLVHLKKELAGLKKMKESLGQYQIAEGGEQSSFVAEYAHMQKFVNELEKIKAAHSKLAEMLDNQISEVEGKVASETEKVKEMMGLIEKAPKAKADKKADKKDEKKEEPKAKADKKKAKLDEFGPKPGLAKKVFMDALKEKGISVEEFMKNFDKQSRGMKKLFDALPKSEKDALKGDLDEARFEKGEDVGKPGKGFAKIAKSAAKQYGSKEAGQKVAGAILKKVVAKNK